MIFDCYKWLYFVARGVAFDIVFRPYLYRTDVMTVFRRKRSNYVPISACLIDLPEACQHFIVS